MHNIAEDPVAGMMLVAVTLEDQPGAVRRGIVRLQGTRRERQDRYRDATSSVITFGGWTPKLIHRVWVEYPATPYLHVEGAWQTCLIPKAKNPQPDQIIISSSKAAQC